MTILTDPDGYEICFVGDIGFYLDGSSYSVTMYKMLWVAPLCQSLWSYCCGLGCQRS